MKKEDIGCYDNFFHVGGDSIKLLKVYNQLKKHITKPFQVVDLFQYTTIRSLAEFFSEGKEKQMNESHHLMN